MTAFGEDESERKCLKCGWCEFRSKKELLGPAVVPVVVGKVEIWRETLIGAGLRRGCVLENPAVELRGSGKVGWRG